MRALTPPRSTPRRDRDLEILGETTWDLLVVGGGVNYGIYALLITFIATFTAWPVLAVLVSTAVSMLINFSAAKWILQEND